MFRPLIPSHIFHKKNCRFDDWYKEYKKDLINLFTIMLEILDERYEDIIDDYDNNENFTVFVKFIYIKSSKYFLKDI